MGMSMIALMPENQRVLVVDDVSSVLHVIEAALASFTIDIITASDGGSGLALAQQLEPDLILLDIALPVMNGWEVLDALKSDPQTSGIPVIVITAHGESGAAASARESGAVAFIAKPFRPADLRRAVEAHLGGDSAAA